MYDLRYQSLAASKQRCFFEETESVDATKQTTAELQWIGVEVALAEDFAVNLCSNAALPLWIPNPLTCHQCRMCNNHSNEQQASYFGINYNRRDMAKPAGLNTNEHKEIRSRTIKLHVNLQAIKRKQIALDNNEKEIRMIVKKSNLKTN